MLNAAVRQTLDEFAQPRLKPEQLAVTFVDLRSSQPVKAHYRGEARFYPASVIKLFYLAYAHRLLEDGALADSPELRRGLRDMIVESYNEATSYVVDAVTGTTSGPELPPEALAVWSERRGVVTRYFRALGYENTLAQRKPWGEGPYGREKQDMEAHPPARNALSTNDTARLLQEIALGRCVSSARSGQMLALMARDLSVTAGDADAEGRGFSGPGLSPGMKLWSKAGWVSHARHDAALIELPGGGRVVLVVFTEGVEHAQNRRIIPAVVRRVLAGLAD
jgi:beta-lactamase class A